jgi:Fuc2NAc and GlcNAc transferase
VSVYWLLLAAVLVSFLLTRAVMRIAVERRLLDIPNERSSHAHPVPRGGGVAIALTFMMSMAIATSFWTPDGKLFAAILGGGALVALVGLFDDLRDMSVGWRLVLQVLSALWALYWLGGIPEGLLPAAPSALVQVLGIVSIVWLINLYNFMDGIDGLASIETVTVCLGGVVLYACRPTGDMAWFPPAMMLASTVGFLAWNYPPARIFLGDAGSGFLGFMMAVFSVRAAHLDSALFWSWLILLGVFIVDSLVTLTRRALRRQPLRTAHRSHAYQFASRKYRAHGVVSLAVGAINLVWLLPMALLVAKGRVSPIPALLIAYLPLIGLAFYLKAGAAELQELEPGPSS